MIDISKIEKIMALMEKYGIDVIHAEEGSERIALSRNGSPIASHPAGAHMAVAAPMVSPAPSVVSTAAAMATHSEAAAPARAEERAPKTSDGITVKSPFVGTFYRSASPEAPAFVQMGTRVRKGQTLCIVEAMKIMNEIESEVEGEVVAILAENAKPVEFGTPLFIIKP